MTPPQNQLYFRTWQAAARAHGWNTVAGCRATLALHDAGQLPMWESPALNEIRVDILDTAAIRAAEQRRELTPDDLRHAVTEVAIGLKRSSKKFSNADFDKVLALLRLLSDPTNLKQVMAYEAGGEAGERKRHIHVITRADEAYWQRIARDKFGHTDLDRLTLAELRQLSLTVRNRRAAATSAGSRQSQPQPETQELAAA